jgi:hypothetical protein
MSIQPQSSPSDMTYKELYKEEGRMFLQGEAFEASPLSLEQAVGVGQDPKGHLLLAFLVGVL